MSHVCYLEWAVIGCHVRRRLEVLPRVHGSSTCSAGWHLMTLPRSSMSARPAQDLSKSPWDSLSKGHARERPGRAMSAQEESCAFPIMSPLRF